MIVAAAFILALVTPAPLPSPSPLPEINAAETLISPIRSFSIQAAYTASSYGPGNAHATTIIPRIASFYLGRSLVRVTLPRFQTINGVDSSYGDTQFFYLFQRGLRERGRYAGFFLQVPTGSGPLTTGKWLAGPALAWIVSFRPRSRTIGFLLQTAFSVAGPRSAGNQSAISFLPIANVQLGNRWFLKTPESPWLFDLQHGSTFVPFGAGLGRSGSLDGVPMLVALTDEVALVHANLPRSPKNVVRFYVTFILKN